MFASVIIAVYNESKNLPLQFNAWQKQTDKTFEVIYVDDGSKDNTRELIKNSGHRLIEQKHDGPAKARNLGATKAKGEIILFTDGDCIPDRNWIKEMKKPFENKNIVGCQGIYKPYQKELIARFTHYEIEDRYDLMSESKYIDFIGTYSAGYRKEIYLKEKGFDTSFKTASGEDPELSFRLAKKGYKMVLNKNAIIYHNGNPTTLKKYLKVKFWRGYWRVNMYKKHPEKAIKDTYTPQSLKLQIILMGLFGVSIITGIFLLWFFYVALALLVLFLLTTLPLTIKNIKKDLIVGLITPYVKFLTTIMFILGLSWGIIKRV